MNKIYRFFWSHLVVFSLIVCLFFSQTNLALATPIKLPDLISNGLSGIKILGFTALPLQYKNSTFSQCQEIETLLPINKIENLGDLNFPVSTSNKKAQSFFNQGMTLFYSFNDEDAIRSFKKAADLDPNFAMAYYGMALAAGSNINITIDQKCLEFARTNINIAYNLLQNNNKGIKDVENTNNIEKQLIDALKARYADASLTVENEDYAKSMQEVYKNNDSNPDVTTLYADSLMNLHPWQLWAPDGKPAQPETNTVVEVLEKALALNKNSNHVGLNRYYIHAMEASAEANKANRSANILTSLAPAAGHINHMPSHIYARVGDYEKAAEANKNAVQVDRPYVDNCRNKSSKNCVQLYTGHYNSHDLLFFTISYAMTGQYNKALEQADEIEKFVPQYLKNQPGLLHYLPTKILMLERFGRSNDILSLSEQEYKSSAVQAFWHWTRAMAYLGKKDLASAKDEKDKFFIEVTKTPCSQGWGNNQAQDILQIAALELNAKIADLEGKANNALELLKIAVDKQDNLIYDEPIPWFPIREANGAVLYANERYNEAEQVFREDISGIKGKIDRRANHNNGRSLFGLYKSLEAQGKTEEAEKIKAEFSKVWQKADVKLKMSDLF